MALRAVVNVHNVSAETQAITCYALLYNSAGNMVQGPFYFEASLPSDISLLTALAIHGIIKSGLKAAVDIGIGDTVVDSSCAFSLLLDTVLTCGFAIV